MKKIMFLDFLVKKSRTSRIDGRLSPMYIYKGTYSNMNRSEIVRANSMHEAVLLLEEKRHKKNNGNRLIKVEIIGEYELVERR